MDSRIGYVMCILLALVFAGIALPAQATCGESDDLLCREP